MKENYCFFQRRAWLGYGRWRRTIFALDIIFINYLVMHKNGTQRTALNLSSNAYMNSTTKYTKGVGNLLNGKNQTFILNNDSSLPAQHFQKNVNLSNIVTVDSTNKNKDKRSTSKQQVLENDREKSADKSQYAAMKLSAQIFMNSTTKFLKGFENLTLKFNPQRKDRNESPLPQRAKRSFSINKREQNRSSSPTKYQKNHNNFQSSKYMPSPFKQAKQISQDKIVYPSKQKIQKIINSKSISPLKIQNKLQQTLNRNRLNSERINRERQSSKSYSRSGSKSLGRFSRRKQKVRELKFIEKKENSMSHRQATNRQEEKINNPRLSLNQKQTKSADSKIIVSTPLLKQAVGLKPISSTKPQINKNAQKKIVVTSLISSQYSQPSIRRQGYHINAMLPSGQLPLQTPVKPKINYQSSKINTRLDQKPKGKQSTQITIIKQENTSSLTTSKYNKGQQNPSIKEQTSTHIDYNTVIATNTNPNKNVSKFDKNQSTIAMGKSQIYGLSTLIKMQQSQLNQDARSKNMSSIFQAKKPVPKKMNGEKEAVIQVQPIQNTSLISQKSMQKITIGRNTLKSPQLQQIPSKSQASSFHLNDKKSKVMNSVLTLKQPSKIITQSVSQPVNLKSKEKCQPTKPTIDVKQLKQVVKYEINSLLKKLSIVTKITNRINRNNLNTSFLKFKAKSKLVNNKFKQAIILNSSISTINHNLYHSNLRIAFQRLKKISLTNPINKKPLQSKSHCKYISSNLIYRVCLSKIRQNFNKLRSQVLLKTPQEIVLKQRGVKDDKKEGQSELYLLSQMNKIIKRHPLNIFQRCFNKLILNSLQSKLKQQKLSLQINSNQEQSNYLQEYQQRKSTLLYNKQAFQSQILRLTSKISQKRRLIKNQKDKLLKTQDILLKNNTQLNNEVTQKTNKNNELKNCIDKLYAKQLDLQLPQLQSSLQLLTEVYDTIFRQTSQLININQLFQRFSILKQSRTALLQQWISLSENIRLKSQIAQWQGQNKLHRSKQILISEKGLISKLLRSNIRQRYLWQCVKLAADRL